MHTSAGCTDQGGHLHADRASLMAVVILGNLVGQARGSIGGVTFSNSRAGPFVRSRVGPLRRTTNRHAIARSDFSLAAHYWRAELTNNQREAWNELADRTPFKNSLGLKMYLSGFALFMRNNILRPVLGLSYIATAPDQAIRHPAAVTLIHQVGVGEYQSETLAVFPDTFDYYTFVQVSVEYPRSAQSNIHPWPLTTWLSHIDSDHLRDYANANLTYSVDARYFFSFRTCYDDGATSPRIVNTLKYLPAM